jgi:hypothetical protein
MLTRSAVELVSGLIFRPGWTLTSEACGRFEECIIVRFDYPAPDYSREFAKDGYCAKAEPHASFRIPVRDLDDIGLYRALLDKVAIIDGHEAREALRVRPTMWSPFNPHRLDGMERYGCAERDLLFGVT